MREAKEAHGDEQVSSASTFGGNPLRIRHHNEISICA